MTRLTCPIVSFADLEGDTHGLFRRHRPRVPLIKREDGAWIVLRAADVRRIAGDSRAMSPDMMMIRPGPLAEFSKRIMLFSNGDAHARRRSPFVKLLTPPVVVGLRAHLREAAEQVIDGWYEDGQADLVAMFAARLPAVVIGRLLGLPEAEVPQFARLVTSVARFLSSASFGDLPAIEADLARLEHKIERLFAERRAAPCDDFITSFLATLDENGSLSAQEAVAQIAILVLAATDTTRVAKATQIALLLAHREQWELVCRDPACRRGAVVESLRFEPSVASFYRVTAGDIAVGDHVIPRDEVVMLSSMSALRDQAIYLEPDRFDVLRSDHPKGHAVFGGGPHRCLGEALALAQLEEGLGALAERLPRMRLVGSPPVPRGHSGIRHIDKVRVAWT